MLKIFTLQDAEYLRLEGLFFRRWDVNVEFVLVAKSEEEARQFAAAAASDEGPEVWLDRSRSIATLVGIAIPRFVKPGVVMNNFRAG